MISKYKKILTFFAHPDDETLAAGATINKLSNSGSQVTLLFQQQEFMQEKIPKNLEKKSY